MNYYYIKNNQSSREENSLLRLTDFGLTLES